MWIVDNGSSVAKITKINFITMNQINWEGIQIQFLVASFL